MGTDKSVAKSKIERRNHAKSTFLKKCLGNFVCDHCNLSFKKILLLKKHIKNVHSKKTFHSNAGSYSCDDCCLSFRNMSEMKRHTDCVHLKLKPNKCFHCEMAFFKKSDLKRHINNVHFRLEGSKKGEWIKRNHEC